MALKDVRFVPVAKIDEIPPGEVRVFEVEGLSLAVSNIDGNFYAIDDLCTHDDGPLGSGKIHGFAIECPRHGARFDVRTGKVLRMPAVQPVRAYRTRIEGDQVLVEIEG